MLNEKFSAKKGPLGLLPVCVVWDDTCAFCARSIRIIQRLDVWNLVHTVPASKVMDAPAHWLAGWRADDTQRGLWCRPIDVTAQELLLHKPCVGFKAVRRLGWVLPLTWPVFWLGYVPLLSWVGDIVYAWIAKNRHRWGCESSSCGP
jgi:predicted DCC family thiol-disulfide oxidoreductase YuxK